MDLFSWVGWWDVMTSKSMACLTGRNGSLAFGFACRSLILPIKLSSNQINDQPHKFTQIVLHYKYRKKPVFWGHDPLTHNLDINQLDERSDGELRA